jgi:taurine dioxygenase
MTSIRQLGKSIAAEVVDIDLSQPLDAPTQAQILDAFYTHQVLAFRNQKLTPEQYLRFGRYFGELEPFFLSRYNLENYPNIYVLSNVKKDGKLIGRYGAGMHWHSDHTYQEAPASATFLYAIEVPPEGGDTLFINNYAAYESLPEDVKQRIEGLRAIHHYHTQEHLYTAESSVSEEMRQKIAAHGQEEGATKTVIKQSQTEIPDVTHPIVRTHPVTGRKALYLNEALAIGIEGMPEQEGKELLQFLCDWAVNHTELYRHKWQVGDVVVWDNPSMMHTGTFTDPKYPRTHYRLTTTGSVPY